VVSVEGKGPARRDQVRFRETSVSEPLMRCRKQKDDVETGGVHHSRISPGENLFTAWAASGIKVA